MRFKRLSTAVCWLGFALIILSALYYLMTISSAHDGVNISLQQTKGISGWLNVLGIVALVVGFVWREMCFTGSAVKPVKTILLSVGLSAACAVFLYGCFVCVLMGIDAHPSDYPYAFPFYRTVALDGFCGLAGLGICYCVCRSKKWSAKGLLLDVVIAFVLLIPFIAALGMAESLAWKIFF